MRNGYSAFEPAFLGSLKNVTVVQGKDANFRCMVDNLGGHRIAWIKVDSKAILAIHDNVITNNQRLTVTMNDKVTWTLHIRTVERADQGFYMCQINTEPMKMQMAYLEVVIPPDIISNETSGDLMVPEGGTAKLICKAKGYPKPTITWRKEDGSPIIIKEGQGGKRKVKLFEGEILTLSKIVRSEMGAYFCIASNGVPPSVSKRVVVLVHFHPLIQVPNQMVAAPKGVDLTIECSSEASPKAINYWTRETGEMIIKNDKYRMDEEILSHYGIRMKLHIRNVSTRDYTGYKCISQNSMGSTEGTIHIHEIPYSNSDLDDPTRDRFPLPADDNDIENRHRPSTRGPPVDHHHPHHHSIETPSLSSSSSSQGNYGALSSLSFLLVLGCSAVFHRLMIMILNSHVHFPNQ
ncbi:unnamed protein product [Orchesella dallaii]|uniref:Ig-like domain-containing protein n=1 Tax=Orchesella dallaii TaxID=48710 RepID=A0ABP1QGZ8_9HEXA